MSIALFIIIISTVTLYFVSQEKYDDKCSNLDEKDCSEEYSILKEDFLKKGVIVTVINMVAQELFIFAA